MFVMQRERRGSSVLLSGENRWEACMRVCMYAYAFGLCAFVRVDAFVCGGPRGAQVQRREICSVGRVDVSNA